jgi:hypothetical protein
VTSWPIAQRTAMCALSNFSQQTPRACSVARRDHLSLPAVSAVTRCVVLWRGFHLAVLKISSWPIAQRTAMCALSNFSQQTPRACSVAQRDYHSVTAVLTVTRCVVTVAWVSSCSF